MNELYNYRELYFLLEATRKLKNYLALYKNRKNLKSEDLAELYLNFDIYFLLIVTATDKSFYRFISHRTRYLKNTQNLNNFKNKKRKIYLNTLILILKENSQIWSPNRLEDYEYMLNRILRIQKKYRNKFIHTNAKEDKQYSWLKMKRYPYNPWEAREMYRYTFVILKDLYRNNKKYLNYLNEINKILPY